MEGKLGISLKSPLWVFLAYVFITLAITAYGPIKFRGFELQPVFTYVCFFAVLFAFGYLLGLTDLKYDKKARLHARFNQNRRLSEVLLYTKACILLITIIRLAEVGVFLVEGGNLQPSNLGEAYSTSYEGYERNSGNYSATFLIRIITYIPYLSAIILGVYYWKKLDLIYKLGIVTIFLSVIITETLGHGKQKQVGDFLIFILIAYFLSMNHSLEGVMKRFYKVGAATGLVGILGFIFILKARYEAIGVSGLNVNNNIHRRIQYDTDHFIFEMLGPIWGFAASAFSGYLSQGWYGLSMGLQLPFKWTYGVGNSYSMTVLLSRFGGLPLEVEDSYPYRIGAEFGWGESKWHSAFSWFASDFTFIGTAFFFSAVAFVWSRSYSETVKYRNPLSALVFTILTLGVIFIPANNQLLHTPESALALGGILIIWVLFRGRYNFTISN